jgi:hypothetical protein
MIFLETSHLGWQIVINNFFEEKMPKALKKVFPTGLQNILEYVLNVAIEWGKKYGVRPMEFTEI